MRTPGARTIDRALQAAVVAALACGPLGAPAATVFVDDVADGRTGSGAQDDPYRDLQTALDAARDGDEIVVLPGTYAAVPASFVEPLCGNCLEHRTEVAATRGFLVEGKSVGISGAGAQTTTLVTNAGYGVLFEDCPRASLAGVTVTGGVRDADGNATDAAVVVRRSRVTLSGLEIADNAHLADGVVVGICGIVGREGAEIVATGNVIRDNGWDGVALYRGAVALVADNEISRGRGAGIGITWDSVATVLRNRVSGHWKGIGAFGSSRAVVRNNAVFDNLGWGIVATGSSWMEASNNAVVRNGNCGVALWSDDATLVLSSNIVAANGWRDEWVCPRVGVWLAGDRDGMDARFNDVWGNAEGDYGDMEDLTGLTGNISIDPAFADSLSFVPAPGSPVVDAGDTLRTDPDGGRTDIGIRGGPAAR